MVARTRSDNSLNLSTLRSSSDRSIPALAEFACFSSALGSFFLNLGNSLQSSTTWDRDGCL